MAMWRNLVRGREGTNESERKEEATELIHERMESC
jgi:hypothetical protein